MTRALAGHNDTRATDTMTRALALLPLSQLVEGKYRKLVDGVIDYDWKGF